MNTAGMNTPETCGLSPENAAAENAASKLGACSRRRFLLGTAATAAGALLAACASKTEQQRVAAADIPVGGGVVVGDYVVTQPKEGVFKAWSNYCPHQGGKIDKVVDGVMICPEHNSKFDIETGAVVSGPSRHPAGAAKLGNEGQDLLVGEA
ncbi:Rieske (2Fe-2S) protein [Corynebacterium sp. H78]|uniref:Rieske (2Fe-2S) protein n=1 Tax=Corynebacterium sp. H78 TaxID=3133417 RepID=UPI0030AF2F89